MGTKTKKSTYNAEVQKRYEAKRKKCAFSVFNDEYEKIIAHMQKKGFVSVNAYLLALVRADMAADTPAED